MQTTFKTGSHLLISIARVLLSNNLLKRSNTPLILAAYSYGLIAAMSGVNYWIHHCVEVDGYEDLPIELTIYNAIDVFLVFYSFKMLDPATYTMIQMLLFAVNRIREVKHDQNRRYAILLCVVGATLAIFSSSSPIQYYGLLIGLLSSYVSLKIRKLSAQHKFPAKSEFVSSLMASMVLILTSTDEASTFNTRLFHMKLFPFIIILNAVVLWRYKRAHRKIPKTLDSATYVLTAITAAFITSTKYSIWLQLLSMAMVAMAIYITHRAETLTRIDAEHEKKDTRSTIEEDQRIAYIKYGALAVVLWITIFGHMSASNPDVKLWTANATEAVTLSSPKSGWDFNDKTMPEGARRAYRMQCLHKTRAQIMNLVMPLIPADKNFTILDYPNHWNLGDAFIYQGETAIWTIYGQIPIRPAFPHYSLKELFRRELNIEGGTIFLHGGGNFGDIYPASDNYRWKVLRAFKTLDVVMLPQSIHYGDPKRLTSARANYNAHRHLTMMLRDYDSYEFAAANFKKGNPIYVPDAAFMLGHLLPNVEPVVDIVFLLRRDAETVLSDEVKTVQGLAAKHKLTSELWDFPAGGFPVKLNKEEVMWNFTKIFPDRVLPTKMNYPSTEGIVSYRTELGNTVLSRGRVVVADRLHASIMATLIDRPVVYIDNSYKKLTRVRSSLTERIPECSDHVLNAHFAPDVKEAINIAVQLVQKINKA